MKHLAYVAPLCALLSTAAFAADFFAPLSVTGYNFDGIVERNASPPYGSTGSNTAQNLDTLHHALFEFGLPGTTAGGLPQGGSLSFTVNSKNYTFQLAPYGTGTGLSYNILNLPASTSGTLTLTAPGKFASVAVLGFSTESGGVGAPEMVGDATLHFSDGSSTPYSGSIDLSDWYAASPVNTNIVGGAIGGLVNTTGVTAGAAFEATAGGPKFYVSVITLTGADANKNLTSVTIGSFPYGGNGYQFVMGLAGSVSSPTITKAFGAATIAVNGTTSLSLTITNPNSTSSVTGVAFTDALPAGLVVSTPNGQSGTCGGTITAVPGSGSVSLTGAPLAGSASCTFAVNVTGTTAGVKSNTTGTISSTEGGTGSTASASVTVDASPTITKTFGAATIAVNGTTSLSFTITNPNGSSVTSVAFTDTLPAGLVVSTPNGQSGSCGGGTITAVAGSGSVSLTGAPLAGSASCTFAVNVTGTTAGVKSNTTGTISSNEGGTGSTASASVTVSTLPPTITKAFGASTIGISGTTSLSFTITNPNTVSSVTGVAFTDTLPAGLVVNTPNGLTGSCGGGTITATAGSGSISLTGATLAGSASCTFAVNVTGTSAGTKNNTTGTISSNEGGTGGTASASLAVVASVPVLGTGLLALLALMLGISGWLNYRRRASSS